NTLGMTSPIEDPPGNNAGGAYAQRPAEPEADRFRGSTRARSNILVELLVAARRNLLLVIVVWAICTISSIVYSIALIPVFTSTGVLQVSANDSLGSGNPLAQMSLFGGNAELETEVEIVRRRELVLS